MKAETLINLLTEEQVIKLVMLLGSGQPKTISNALVFNTICHNISGGSYKLYYYPHSRTFRCYTDCNETFDIIGLVKKVNDCDYKEAIKFICSKLSIQDEFSYIKKVGFGDESYFDELEYLHKYDKKEETEEITLTRFDENILRIYHKNLFYKGWIDEGITIKAMQNYEISFDMLHNRIIIPHRYVDGKLIGIKTRYVNNDDVKYVPLTHNFITYKYPTGLNLYGLYRNWKAINRKKKIVLFESEKSVMKAESYYGEDNNFTVAICGSNLTKEHIALLLKLNIEEVIIAVDKEFTTPEEALVYEKKIRKVFVNKLISYFNVSVIWDTDNLTGYKDSPIDCGKAIFETLFENRIRIKE